MWVEVQLLDVQLRSLRHGGVEDRVARQRLRQLTSVSLVGNSPIRGVDPDVAPYLGRTGLHWAIPGGHLEVIRLLLERGADPSIRDDLLQIDADGWLHMSHAAHPHDPVTQRIHDLIETRSR
ncbi:hypothetical protein ACIBQ1_37840 [Nonomuraea sp. NPDC050153]|uniref:hypothetical protein n=1 Tax=Nonomuraea sp. NPDC050153 TaxID=3364359 RepID=UPI00379C63A3